MAKALYVAYFTGVAGQSIGLFYIGDGVLVGVDVATMQYDGSYQTKGDGSLEGVVEYVLPAGVSLITGAPAGVAPNVRQRLQYAGAGSGSVVPGLFKPRSLAD
jgi:hypothetical protein